MKHHSFSAGSPWLYVALLALSGLPISQAQENAARADRADVVVFGATPAGVTAAVAAARAGQRLRLIEPGTKPCELQRVARDRFDADRGMLSISFQTLWGPLYADERLSA